MAAELGALTWQALTAPAHGLLSADNKGSVELAGIHFATVRRDRAPAALLVTLLATHADGLVCEEIEDAPEALTQDTAFFPRRAFAPRSQ